MAEGFLQGNISRNQGITTFDSVVYATTEKPQANFKI